MPGRVGILGAGIVGLATAYRLHLKYPDLQITLLEKEDAIATHQTGRNSGVIHSGIYYKPGSLKAQTCRSGKMLLEAFCRDHGINFETCGKVIVAKDESELGALEQVRERGDKIGVASRVVSKAELLELEPHVTGISALHVPETGIVDYVQLCNRLKELLAQAGHSVLLGKRVTGIKKGVALVVIETPEEAFEFDFVVNCAGLYSDKLAELAGHRFELKIVPFRGEYFDLTPEAHHFCRNLIYPVPDIKFPFLGVHFTRMIGGGVECGPNAVLAFAREGYDNTTVNGPELLETLTFGGFQKMALRHWKMGLGEMHRSFSKGAFVKALQGLVPEIEERHLVKAEAGVRAQAVGKDGKPIDDFAFAEDDRCVHVLNAPSPAATACFAIGNHIVAMLETRFSPGR